MPPLPKNPLAKKVIFSQIQFLLKTKKCLLPPPPKKHPLPIFLLLFFSISSKQEKLDKILPPLKKNPLAKKIISQFQIRLKTTIDLNNFKKSPWPNSYFFFLNFNFFNSNCNSWVDSRRSACAMGKVAPPLANAIFRCIAATIPPAL